MSKPAIATVFYFRSETNTSKTYETLIYVDGSKSCNCPAWTFRRKTSANGDRTCKHIRWIDAGMGNQHAERTVEYSAVVAVPRVPQRAMPQAILTGRRAFDFSNT